MVCHIMNPTLNVMVSAEAITVFGVRLDGEIQNRLNLLPPPASSNKPLTPFSIVDILSKPHVQRNSQRNSQRNRRNIPQLSSSSVKHLPSNIELLTRTFSAQTSPLCALQELASKTFNGLEVGVLQAAEGRDSITLFGQRSNAKKRRKSRTAFTNHQIYELEQRFLYQKYLSPADRDQIATQLGLTNAQVITWFQNRRAKLKRDLDELRADVESARAVCTVAGARVSEVRGPRGGPRGPGSPARTRHGHEVAHKLCMSPLSDHTSPQCSEEEDVEIDVDD